MKSLSKLLCVLTLISFITISFCTSLSALEPNKLLLPNPFPVYTHGTVVVNHSYPGFKRKALPINNDFKKNPGCYMACYSHDQKNAIYAVSNDIFVLGMVRIPGQYSYRICMPDASQSKNFPLPDLCNKYFKSCGNNCWVGGETGGFFGVQSQ